MNTTQTIEMCLMTYWGYTWDRACELVNDHISHVSRWKQGGFANDEIANKIIQLRADIQSHQDDYEAFEEGACQ